MPTYYRLGGRPGDYDYRLGYRAEEVRHFICVLRFKCVDQVMIALRCYCKVTIRKGNIRHVYIILYIAILNDFTIISEKHKNSKNMNMVSNKKKRESVFIFT